MINSLLKGFASTLFSVYPAQAPLESDEVVTNYKISRPLSSDRDATRYEMDTEISGVVSGCAPYGVFIRLPNGESGLVGVNEVCWPGEKITYSRGDAVKIVIIGFKVGRGLALSIRKARIQIVFDEFLLSYPVGSIITGQIKTVLDYGVFVVLAPGVDGLLHVTQISDNKTYSKSSVGSNIKVRVIKIDNEAKRIALTIAP